MKILFICKYNAFRSRICEEYFNKINKNKDIKVISRGIIKGAVPKKAHVEISKKILGININKRKPKELTIEDLISSDLIIVSADDIPKIIFNYKGLKNKKIIFWKIKDEQEENQKNIKQIILLIKRKVDELNKKLQNEKNGNRTC